MSSLTLAVLCCAPRFHRQPSTGLPRVSDVSVASPRILVFMLKFLQKKYKTCFSSALFKKCVVNQVLSI